MTIEHSQDRKCLIFPEEGKLNSLENPRGTAENQRTSQLTYGPGRESNRGHLGEWRALFAQANHATQFICLKSLYSQETHSLSRRVFFKAIKHLRKRKKKFTDLQITYRVYRR